MPLYLVVHPDICRAPKIRVLMDCTPEYDDFDVMVTLIEAYESKYFPIEQPDPDDKFV